MTDTNTVRGYSPFYLEVVDGTVTVAAEVVLNTIRHEPPWYAWAEGDKMLAVLFARNEVMARQQAMFICQMTGVLHRTGTAAMPHSEKDLVNLALMPWFGEENHYDWLSGPKCAEYVPPSVGQSDLTLPALTIEATPGGQV